MQHLNHVDQLPSALDQSDRGMAWIVNDRKYIHCTACQYQRPLSPA